VVSGAAGVGKKSKKQDDLTNMETVLEITLQNRATRTQWLTAMQNFGRGWSEANFDKKLGVLKSQKRVTGGGAQGEYYSVSYSPEAQRARGQAVLVGAAEGAESRKYPQAKEPSPSSP
jgi:hypothetical protein